MARNMAIDFNMPVAFILEMASVQLITFNLIETGLSSRELRVKLNMKEQLSTKVKFRKSTIC
jgi:hypothetical protein